MSDDDCNCACHDLGGGPFHHGERCRCNGGTGYDDMADWTIVLPEGDEQ